MCAVVDSLQAVLHPDATYYSVKRLIGRPFIDPAVQEELPRVAYQVVCDEEGQVAMGCRNVAPGKLYPEEVSAQVLSQLLADARGYTRATITKAVISVPAYFNEQQRDATVTAGRIAGLETVRIIREPVAAALAYGLDVREDQTVLVFDLGGGTFDVSILEVGNGTVEVLSTGGDAHLGGDDWDAAIVDFLVSTHLGPAGIDCTSPMLRANLKALAEGAKMTLSMHESVVLRMPVGGPKGGPLEVPFTRDQFEKLTEHLWRRCRQPLDQACWQAGVDLGQAVGQLEAKKETLRSRGVPTWKLDTLQPQIRPKRRDALTKILLVGGATRMPAVRRLILNMTGIEPMQGAIDPDEAVALGAAVQAAILQGDISNVMVMDQWQASLMRALAQVQLKSSPETKQAVEERFNLSDEKETRGSKGRAQGSGSPQQAGGEESSEDRSNTETAGGEGSDSEDGVSEEPAVVVQPKKFVPARRDRRAAAQQLRQKEAELAGALDQESE
ncbi:MAG: hypothetical protein WDW36_002546 [Sanguina aurantia]